MVIFLQMRKFFIYAIKKNAVISYIYVLAAENKAPQEKIALVTYNI
jgi:hypothetical protein